MLRAFGTGSTLAAVTLIMLGSFGAAPEVAAQEATGAALERAADADRRFIKRALVAHRFEVLSGKLVREVMPGSELAAFAERMVTDHAAAGESLRAMAVALDVPVPDALDLEHRRRMEVLRGTNEGALKMSYSQMQLDAHRDMVERYAALAADESAGPLLRRYAEEQLPMLRAHLETARSLRPQAEPGPIGAAPRPSAAATATDRAAGPSHRQLAVLIGRDAVTGTGEPMGEVVNVLLSASGAPSAVVVAWGGVLGLGESSAAVPWDEVRLDPAAETVVIDKTRSEIRLLKPYDEAEPGQGERQRDARDTLSWRRRA